MSGKERQQTCRYCRRQYIGKKKYSAWLRKLHGVFLQKIVKNARNIAVNTFNSRSALAVSKISRYQQSQRESADGSGSVPVLPSLKIGRI